MKIWRLAAITAVAGTLMAAGMQDAATPVLDRPVPAPQTSELRSLAPRSSSVAVAAPKPRSSPPARVRVPEIKVDSSLVRLGITPDRQMEVPKDYGKAGWYTESVRPGDVGPAVIAGHVDSVDGPAVFYELGKLDVGSRIEVVREDKSFIRFAVDRVEKYAKDRFPAARVYGDVDRPEIRLITCGGDFDRSIGHYEDNIVVFGHMV